jgi:hypothetical protein
MNSNLIRAVVSVVLVLSLIAPMLVISPDVVQAASPAI